jgi:hypothetical protein
MFILAVELKFLVFSRDREDTLLLRAKFWLDSRSTPNFPVVDATSPLTGCHYSLAIWLFWISDARYEGMTFALLSASRIIRALSRFPSLCSRSKILSSLFFTFF